MARTRSPWFAFYADDYIAGTRDMSLAARGAYLDLLCYQFTHGSIPSDERKICRLIGAFPDEWSEIRDEVLEKFEEDEEGNLVNSRMDSEREKREEIRSKRVQAAGASHESRWGTGSDDDPILGPNASKMTNAEKRSKRLAHARSLARHTQGEWEALKRFCDGCAKCGANGVDLIKDHIRPIYKGGSDGVENLQPLCVRCNSAKGSDETDFRQNGWQSAVERLAKRLTSTTTTTVETLSPAREGVADLSPTWEQVEQAASNMMIPTNIAERFFDDMEACGWLDAKSRPIRNFQHALKAWATRYQDNEARKQQHGGGSRQNGNRVDRNAGTSNAGRASEYRNV